MNTDTQNPTIDKHHPDYRMGTEAELAPDTTVSALLETALETDEGAPGAAHGRCGHPEDQGRPRPEDPARAPRGRGVRRWRVSETKRIGEYLRAEKMPRPSGRKTDTYRILSNHGGELGRVAWFGRWRQYTFDPAPSTTFNNACLTDLAAFLAEVNAAHRKVRSVDLFDSSGVMPPTGMGSRSGVHRG